METLTTNLIDQFGKGTPNSKLKSNVIIINMGSRMNRINSKRALRSVRRIFLYCGYTLFPQIITGIMMAKISTQPVAEKINTAIYPTIRPINRT